MTASRRILLSALRVIASGALVVFSIVGTCAETATLSNEQMLDRILAGIQNPAMRQRWLDAHQNGTLPALNKIPLPSRTFSKRSPNRLRVAELPPRKPIISDNTIIDVQPYSMTARSRYEGAYVIRSQEVGNIKGTIGARQEPFEILYRLPGRKALQTLETDVPYRLIFRDDVEDSAQQRRVILFDEARRRLPLAIIAEGSRAPYQTTLEPLALTITQQRDGPSPTVSLSFDGKTHTLKQGEQKNIGTGSNSVTVYLVTSYHDTAGPGSLTEGQPYYVRIIFFQ